MNKAQRQDQIASTAQAAGRVRVPELSAALIRDGETRIIDAGTTTLVAESWPTDIRFRAMALSLRVADVLADMPNVTLMIPGGVVRMVDGPSRAGGGRVRVTSCHRPCCCISWLVVMWTSVG